MNKLLFLNIVCLLLGITCNAKANFAHSFQKDKDSVLIDTDYITKRDYNNLKERYNGNEFIYERTVESSGWWMRFKQWLSDFFKDLFNFGTDAKASDFTNIAINTFYIILFLLVVFFIVKAVMNKEGNWVFGKSSDKRIIPVTDIEQNIYDTNFKSLVNAAENENNYRLAIRYYYLWLLKTLSEAGIFAYDVEKTNSDYYLEIKNEDTKKEFSYTSYLYNYIWYGEFDIDEHQFKKAKDAFTQFLNNTKI